MTITERILEGIEGGVNRHWRYVKELIKVKPEYLLTISVADSLTKGFDNIHGIDVGIRLEERTDKLASDILFSAVGIHKFFETERPKIKRKGKVDIYLKCDSGSFAVELKNFDPSAIELQKELIRTQQLLLINDGNNTLRSAYVAFPTLIDRSLWIDAKIKQYVDSQTIEACATKKYIKTDEDPMDGIPAYYANCICLARKDAQQCVQPDLGDSARPSAG